ncbi:nucleotide exchange factor GrpE [Iamia sp. SCSIO 61187]|uniref:nucleotide exchange factor GrpE n=1 Tax=Iamia sp. SCSIO 61187 TaxID=2722752 RepID=UPI001C62D590|nr:nucleotide exchange factor GrpE [Iamia sp. SCSIO 61187]QYG91331.1 nucleotide exchange factor GrpE [Iamia sp. SCSIO 61187]
MSDAAAPGPSPEDAETEPTPAAPPDGAPGGTDDVPTGEPDAVLVAEATGTGDEGAGAPDPAPATDPETEVPTGEPDAVLVAEVTGSRGGAAGEPVGDAAPTPPEDAPPTPEEPSAGDGDLAPLLEEVAGARADITGVREGVDSLLPDLAATAREETVSTGLAGLQRSVEELVRLTRRADEHVAELHGENQRLRAGELASATRPMLRDLVRLSDEVAQLTSACHPEARADLELVGSRLIDTLARWGLTPFTPAVGDPLDATRHQGVGRVASTDGEPGTIASVRRPGFADDEGRAFRPAEVEVFAAPPPPDDDTPSEE